jgi:hypothetical protein
MTLSTYKDLLCKLDAEISKLVQSFCRSETYGYKTCKDKLQKLIYTKQLLENNFIRVKLDKNFYCLEETEDYTITKTLIRIIGTKAEILVKKIKKIIKTDKSFVWDFPPLPQPNGVWVGSFFVPVPVNTLADIENVKIYLENKKLFSFFAFAVDYSKKQILSSKYLEEEIEECIEYQEIDKYCLQCLDELKLKRLIETI